jgi:hypothetical protein
LRARQRHVASEHGFEEQPIEGGLGAAMVAIIAETLKTSARIKSLMSSGSTPSKPSKRSVSRVSVPLK